MTPLIDAFAVLSVPAAAVWFLWNTYQFQIAYRREFGEPFRDYDTRYLR